MAIYETRRTLGLGKSDRTIYIDPSLIYNKRKLQFFSGDVPCEWCGRRFPADELLLHKVGCAYKPLKRDTQNKRALTTDADSAGKTLYDSVHHSGDANLSGAF